MLRNVSYVYGKHYTIRLLEYVKVSLFLFKILWSLCPLPGLRIFGARLAWATRCLAP